MTTADSLQPEWQVICLCAAWCGVCRDWRAMFEQAAAAHPQLAFSWVDVEDEADAMGDVDIETFPTLLIAQGTQARFLGPVPPSQAQLSRLVDTLLADAGAGAPVAADAGPLLLRLKPVVLQKL